MSVGAIFLLLAVLIVVVLILSRPFMDLKKNTGDNLETIQTQMGVSTLLAEKERLFNTLQELDLDHASGKIPEDTYPTQRKALLRETAVVLAKLDEVAAQSHNTETSLQADQDKDGYDELEEMIARRKQSGELRTTGFCPKCGKPVHESDHFCPKCGNQLKK